MDRARSREAITPSTLYKIPRGGDAVPTNQVIGSVSEMHEQEYIHYFPWTCGLAKEPL